MGRAKGRRNIFCAKQEEADGPAGKRDFKALSRMRDRKREASPAQTHMRLVEKEKDQVGLIRWTRGRKKTARSALRHPPARMGQGVCAKKGTDRQKMNWRRGDSRTGPGAGDTGKTTGFSARIVGPSSLSGLESTREGLLTRQEDVWGSGGYGALGEKRLTSRWNWSKLNGTGLGKRPYLGKRRK